MPARLIFIGNGLFVVCCAFYLAWWVVRFRPIDPIMGTKSGWLLVPAAIAGLAGVVCALWGVSRAGGGTRLFPNFFVLVGWILGFILLAVVTRWVFDRPVTSELILFTGWAALVLVEVNALYGSGVFSHTASLVFIIVIGVVLIASLVCYVLYYRLGAWPSFIDRMVPLVLTALVMASLDLAIVSG